MNVFKKMTCVALLASTLTGCVPGAGPKQTAGHLLGGAGGALIGSQFGKGTGQLVGVAIGALAGSALGGMIGQKMDERDRALAQSTMVSTLERAPDHQVRSWKNPNNNHSGNFRVTRTQEMPANNLVCRDYVHTVLIDGRQEQIHGRACRDIRDTRAQWFVQN
jgi:surface antigen